MPKHESQPQAAAAGAQPGFTPEENKWFAAGEQAVGNEQAMAKSLLEEINIPGGPMVADIQLALDMVNQNVDVRAKAYAKALENIAYVRDNEQMFAALTEDQKKVLDLAEQRLMAQAPKRME